MEPREKRDCVQGAKADLIDCYKPELRTVKILFQERNYRHCVRECRRLLDGSYDTLPHPIQKAFVHFYLGLAHDELARAMHSISQAKVPAFNQAAQFYRDALEYLPAPAVRENERQLHISAARLEGPFQDTSYFSPHSEAGSISPTAPLLLNPSERKNSTPFSDPSTTPPRRPNISRLPIRSSSSMSTRTASDFDDLESHDSLEEIPTANKLMKRNLERDFSRMSLLHSPPRRPASLPKAVSQGLMRPIRPGSPPKPYHLPPTLEHTGRHATMSRLPRLTTIKTSPIRLYPNSNRGSIAVSPISLFEIGGAAFSDTSAVSPMTPQTPVLVADYQQCQHPESTKKFEATNPVLSPNLPFPPPRSLRLYRINAHITAMREQIETHIGLLEQAKSKALCAQAERAASRLLAGPTTGTPLSASHKTSRGAVDGQTSPFSAGMATSASKGVPKLRSFWSFTPLSQEADQMQRRIESGRARGWARERWDRRRCVELAEKALAEL